MDILVISSILPIPGIKHANDFILKTYHNYTQIYQEDRVVIINPLRINLNPVRILKGKTPLRKLKGKRRLTVQGFQVEILPFLSTWSLRNLHALITGSVYYLNRRRIRALFYACHFDVIHANYIFSDGILARRLSRRYRIPYLIHTHNERFYFQHAISRRIALNILDRASWVLPLNYSNYVYFKSIGIGNLEHFSLGFNPDFLKEQKQSAEERIRIFSVCELIRLKNIDKVIRAMERLKDRYSLTYTIIGKGPEKSPLTALVEELHLQEVVEFIEYVPHEQIAEEMFTHDIFIMPSYFETFGRVYYEVMAMGIPIICAKNSGIHGIFKEREEGLSVDHRSIDSIEEALEYLLSDRQERLRIGRNGQELIKQFTWELIAKDLRSKYEASISGFS